MKGGPSLFKQPLLKELISMLARSLVIGLIALCILALILKRTRHQHPLARWLGVIAFLVGLYLLLHVSSGLASEPPLSSLKYKDYLKQHAKVVWGVEAPIPLFAGQIHQESLWNPTARSAFACGLTQFTPDTAKWISEQYKVDVGKGECTDPKWAMRAMLRYDKHLSEVIRGTRTECDNRRFMLSAYNGGLGWVNRDRNKAAVAGVDNSSYDAAAPFNAGRAPMFFKENRDYPPRIIQHQKLYEPWGGPLTCKEILNATSIQRSESVAPRPRSCDPWRCAGVDRWLCQLAKIRNCTAT